MKFDFSQEPGRVLVKTERNDIVKPLVSIITSFFNAGTFLLQTYNCVINQTFPWFEWIIVDDGSTNQDDIRLVFSLKDRDSRIKIFQKENGGIASARNLAIQHSKTNFIVPLDADDLIAPTYLEVNYWTLMHNPGAAWSYTDSVGFGVHEYLWKKPFSSEIMKVNNLLTCTAMIRKSSFEQIGYYSELDTHFNEDWYAWLKLLSKRFYPAHISGYYFWYRRNNNGVLSKINNNKAIKKKSIKAIKNVAKKISENVEALEFPHALGTEHFLPPSFSDTSVYKPNMVCDKPSILMLIPWMEIGGADAFNISFLNHGKDAYNIGIITTNYSENIWKQRFEQDASEVFELPNFMDLSEYAEFISYYIKTRNVALIFLSNSYIGYYLIPWLKKEFVNLFIVDYVHMEEWYWRNGGFARTSGVFGPLLDKTYVCNAATKKVLNTCFARDSNSVQVSYIGVDYKYYNKDIVPPGQIRKRLNLHNKKIILFPCRLEPQKRPYLMLQIASELKKRSSDYAFVIAGEGSMLSELKIQAKKLLLFDCIFFVGRQDDLRPYYRDSALTLICSLKEGLALTAYESCAMGVPVVTSDVGGQGELINSSVGAIIPILQKETEYNSNLFRAEEINQYTSHILRITRDESYYNKLSQNCQKLIRKEFYSKDMINQLYENLNRLMNMTPSSKKASSLIKTDFLATELATLYSEFENRINLLNYGVDRSSKRELIRIMNSKWGQRIIKLAFLLKINNLFK